MAKNVDGAGKNDSPATKNAKNVDEAAKSTSPATKTPQNVDGAGKNDSPATKTPQNVDGPEKTRPQAEHAPQKTAPAKSRDRFSCAKRLEQVANAKSEALPAEAGGREDVEERTPVKGELQGEVEAVLQTNLCTNAKADVRSLAETSP